MACDAMAIPKLKFPRNEIIEVSIIAEMVILTKLIEQ